MGEKNREKKQKKRLPRSRPRLTAFWTPTVFTLLSPVSSIAILLLHLLSLLFSLLQNILSSFFPIFLLFVIVSTAARLLLAGFTYVCVRTLVCISSFFPFFLISFISFSLFLMKSHSPAMHLSHNNEHASALKVRPTVFSTIRTCTHFHASRTLGKGS